MEIGRGDTIQREKHGEIEWGINRDGSTERGSRGVRELEGVTAIAVTVEGWWGKSTMYMSCPLSSFGLSVFTAAAGIAFSSAGKTDDFTGFFSKKS